MGTAPPGQSAHSTGQRKACSKTSKELELGINTLRRLPWVSSGWVSAQGLRLAKQGAKIRGLGEWRSIRKAQQVLRDPLQLERRAGKRQSTWKRGGVCVCRDGPAVPPSPAGRGLFRRAGMERDHHPSLMGNPCTPTRTQGGHTRGWGVPCLPAGRLHPFPAGNGGARAMVVDN